MKTNILSRLLLLLGLAAIHVSSGATINTKPLEILDRKRDDNDTSLDLIQPVVMRTERRGNGTIAYYGWPDDTPSIVARPKYPWQGPDADDDDEPSPEHPKGPFNTNSSMPCGGPPVYLCDDRSNHAFTEACKILIDQDLSPETPYPNWVYSVCYVLDWDTPARYQCCTSWTAAKHPLKSTDLLPGAAELYHRCNFLDQELGWHVMSGRVIRQEIGGSCVTQCLSNRAEGCE